MDNTNYFPGKHKNTSINIALVDQLTLLTDALRNVLCQMQEVNAVVSYTDGKEFMADHAMFLPDILIMDWAINGMTGLELLNSARSAVSKDLKIIIISSVTDVQTIKHAIRRGANSFLPKSASLEELKEAITHVMLYAPRDDREVDVALQLVHASYLFALGSRAEVPTTTPA